MSQKHFLLSYLEEAERDSTKDYSLSWTSRHQFTEFFKNTDNQEKWNERLDSLKNLDLKRSPLFEAIFLFGQWKIRNDYQKAKESANKFQEMENIALKNGWVWILVYSLECIAYIYKVLSYRKKFKILCRKLTIYISERKTDFRAHTLLELARLFTENIVNADTTDVKIVMDLLVELSEKKYGADHFIFQRHFLCEAIKSANFLKLADFVKELQERTIANHIEEAKVKGSKSKLLRAAILERALDYSVTVGNKERVIELKKKLAAIDVSDEMKCIELPAEQRIKYEKAAKLHYNNMLTVARKYVNKLTQLHPTQIIWNICNDLSIIRINVQETKKFTEELIKKHPLQQIFPLTIYGEKTIRLDSDEERMKHELNQQLMPSFNETFWFINQIFSNLIEKNRLSASSVASFLANCSSLSENSFQLIVIGTFHHFQRNFVASISILTPLIEGALIEYLSSEGADISSYEGSIIENRELGGLLNLEEFPKLFGEDFQYFLKLFLVEADSINFRNRFAHGKVMLGEFNEIASNVILFVILKICSRTFSIKPRNSHSPK